MERGKLPEIPVPAWPQTATARLTNHPLSNREFLEVPLTNWPGEVEPVWSLLEPESAQALRAEPLAGEGAVHLAEDLTEAELAQSAFVLNGLVLLGEMGGGDALWMGTHGNLKMKSGARGCRHPLPATAASISRPFGNPSTTAAE